jgi:hypothetical protein
VAVWETRRDVRLTKRLSALWAAQNPGFDFSGAEFSGACPDPRTFMGGIGYNNS